MKLILVITGAKGKNVVFVSDMLQTYSLAQAVALAREGMFENVYAVKGRTGAYLRTKSSVAKEKQLDRISVSSRLLFSSIAKRFDVDPYLLGAIIIDEIARLNPFENITDSLAGYFVGSTLLRGSPR